MSELMEKQNFCKMNTEIHGLSSPTVLAPQKMVDMDPVSVWTVSRGCLSLACLQICWNMSEHCNSQLMLFAAAGKTVIPGTTPRHDGL
jgi:hypothetical protein